MLIHEIFEAQVLKTPQKIAVAFGNDSISYLKLNEKSNQIAHFLQSKGVSSEVLVAISMDRPINLIICILGILKAGGAYVPIDPAFPMDHIILSVN